MADFPTQRDFFRVARDELLAGNSRITRDAVERPGTDANILTTAASSVGDSVVGQVAQAEKGLYLDSAKGEQLDRLVFDRYGLVRKPAAAAVGEVQFSLPTPALGAFAIPKGTRLLTTDGRQFVVTSGTIFPLASSGPVAVPVRSVLAGLSQQAKPATITVIQDIPAGAQTGLAVTNALATAGADDEETDEAFASRARGFFSTVRRGTIDALIQGAKAFPGVQTAEIIEHVDTGGSPDGPVQVIISDAFTTALQTVVPTPPTYAAQAATLAANVKLALYEIRAAGIPLEVLVALVSMLSVKLSLQYAVGSDPEVVAPAARAAIVRYTNALAPGQTWSYSAASIALAAVPGLVISGNEIVSPLGSVVPTQLQVIRASMDTVNVVAGV